MSYPFSTVVGCNFYEADLPLKQQLARRLDPGVLEWAEGWLTRWGELCGGPIAARAEVIDRNPPRLEAYDRWGHEANRVVHHPDAIASKRDLCEAGYTGFRWQDEVLGHPDRLAAASMLNTAFTYMLCQSDTGMACACGMTSGVARIVERFAPDDLKETFLPRLTTMDYDELWDGSMFMTERSGGSDLSGTETIAIKNGQMWILEGEKWFCSNIDGKAILTLARPEGAGTGTKGLGLYLVPAFLEDGSRNPIKMRRIKDKLGTRSVPTGEVIFDRTYAYEVAGPGSGINQMMDMVNVSRLGVALMGAGIARRCTAEAALYASVREAFGKRIDSYPMVRETLIDMQVAYEGALAMCMEASAVGGRFETGAEDAEALRLLRILTPLAKIRAARVGLEAATQAVEILGGNGYIEDWPTARQLRDAQCHTIWEGTENINSLDVLRSMAKTGAHEALFERIDRALDAAPGDLAGEIGEARREAEGAIAKVSSAPEVHARRFANFIGDVTAAALLAEVAGESDRAALVARRFAQARLGTDRFPDVGDFLGDDGFRLIVID
jgi:acyl-CoA dehydrogenase